MTEDCWQERFPCPLKIDTDSNLTSGTNTGGRSGVVVVGDENPDVGPYSKQSGNTYLGISTLAKTVAKHIQLGGISNFARIRISSIDLDKLRRFLP